MESSLLPRDEGAAPTPPIVACGLPYDALLAFALKALRAFSFGAIAPAYFAYALEAGLTERGVGALVTAVLLGDLAVTLALTTRADRWGRRRTLVVGSLLKLLAGAVFAGATAPWLGLGPETRAAALTVSGVVGVVSTSGSEIGPFLAVEQACLTEAVAAAMPADEIGAKATMAALFGWYNALGALAGAGGVLVSGLAVQWLHAGGPGLPLVAAHRLVFLFYGAVGALMALLYASMSPAVEPQRPAPAAPGKGTGARCMGLRRPESRFIVARLSALFAMDAFAGGFVMQSWVAFWLARRWAFQPDLVGAVLSAANVVAGVSGIAAGAFVRRLGAMRTMVFTHLPSNVLLALVPFMPTAASAGALLVSRFAISQMDVPARQAYVATVVAPDERSAAGGVTNLVRSLGVAASPLLLGYLSSFPAESVAFSAPFVIAGAIKIAYDLILYGLYVCGTELRANESSAARKDEEERAATRA